MMEFDLKEVFSILDENGEGQIQLRRFIDVANNYYSDAEVSSSKQLFKNKRERERGNMKLSVIDTKKNRPVRTAT